MDARARRLSTFSAGLLVVLSLTACSKSTAAQEKFNQTWPTGYGQTTCQQWLAEMTSAQKFVAAADMLVGARSHDDENAGLPSDSLIRSFENDIGQGCEPIATMTISDAAVSIYLIGRDQYAP